MATNKIAINKIAKINTLYAQKLKDDLTKLSNKFNLLFKNFKSIIKK